MSRRVLVLVFVSVAVLFAAGAAFAVIEDCGGGTRRSTDGNGVLYGTPRLDKIFGQGDYDRVYGYRNPDTLKSGGGADTLYGGGGQRNKGQFEADRIYGGGGDDIIRASTIERVDDGARDVIDCGVGTDKVYFVPVQD